MPDTIVETISNAGHPITLLAIDDTDANRYALTRHLRGAGYVVHEAATGLEGLNLAVSQTPDLVILDIRLPDLSGLEVARRLRADERTASIPILHISASFTDPESRAQGLDNGADGYLTHPVDPPMLLATVRALLRARQAERAAQATARAWRATFDAISEGVCVCDPDGKVRRCNRAFRELMHLPYDDVLGHPLPELLPAAQRIAAPPFLQIGPADDASGGLFLFRDQWLRGSAVPIATDAGAVTGVVCVLVDVTRQRETDERIRRSQQLETTGRLAGGVAHEINNLMTIILGYTSLLLRSTADPNGRMDLEQIHRAGHRAVEIARQLLTFSRRHFTQPKIVDVRQLLGGMERTLAHLLGADRAFHLDLGAEPLHTFIDPAELEQTIVNLTLNARDAMTSGEQLTIHARPVRLDAAFSEAHPGITVRHGPYIELTIADTGHGMDAATLTHVFEPFFTTKDVGVGTGLGLSMAYGVVKQADGYIWIDSRPGMGTTIVIHLPRAAAPALAAPPRESLPALDADRGTILLVEDEAALRQLMRRELETAGYDVLEAGDGQEALDKFTPGKIRLILTDIVMPRMSGPTLAETVRASQPDMPILFMSGHASDEIVRRQLLKPGDAFVQKPFKPDDVVRQVQAILRRN
jgi:PAS domain S-box-containing protein